MKLKLFLAFMLVAQISYGQNLFTKAVSKLAKTMGKATNVATTADLAEVSPFVAIDMNLHSNKVGTISQTFFDAWVPGGDMNVLMFTSKRSSNFLKIDGTVTIDGKPVECLTLGLYSQTTEANKAPRRIEITTTTGQTSGFTIKPFDVAPFKVKSINGAADNANLDLTKDVTIELDEMSIPDNALLKVSIAINQASIKSFYDVAFVRVGSTITIPAAAFRNINIKPAGNAVYNYNKSYLQVNYEATENATDVTGSLSSVQYVKSYNDGKFVNVTTEPALNPGLTVKGNTNNYGYEVFKASAFLSRPFSHIKKAGLLSFSIRGTTYQEVTQTSSTTPVRINPFGGASSTTTVATITITKELPWESVLEQLYPELMGVIQSELNATVLPVENITGSESYKIIEMAAYEDPSTKVEFTKTFRNTKVISAFMPISEGYGANGVFQKVMNETGTDALVVLTLDLQLAQESGTNKMLMIPKLAYEISGKSNGRIANTKYATGTIESSMVAGFEKDLTAEQLTALIRKSDLAAAFRKSLQDIKAQENSNGDYELVWNLQK